MGRAALPRTDGRPCRGVDQRVVHIIKGVAVGEINLGRAGDGRGERVVVLRGALMTTLYVPAEPLCVIDSS
jgi:hypothetical protein